MDTIFDFDVPVFIEQKADGTYVVGMELMRLDPMHLKTPCAFPSFPEEYMAPIGACIAQWGAFENSITKLTENVVQFNGSQPVKLHNFAEKKKHLILQFDLAFPDCERLRNILSIILKSSDEMYQKRNLLAHGDFSTEFKINFPDGIPKKELVYIDIIAKGYVKRK